MMKTKNLKKLKGGQPYEKIGGEKKPKKMRTKMDFFLHWLGQTAYQLASNNDFIALGNKLHFTQEHQPCLFYLLMKSDGLCMPCRLTHYLFKDLPANCIHLQFDFLIRYTTLRMDYKSHQNHFPFRYFCFHGIRVRVGQSKTCHTQDQQNHLPESYICETV